MLTLLTAVDRMHTTLIDVDAPIRQLAGVTDWRETIAEAVSVGSRYRYASGMSINDEPRWTLRGWRRPDDVRFIYGSATHAAWRALCHSIIGALGQQAMTAEGLVIHWQKVQAHTQTRAAYVRATKQIAIASDWWSTAVEAETYGNTLVAMEDAIQVPVGKALAKVGRREVAMDKHYHQRRTTR